ncbi:MAG: zinc ribbon domain-containing protein [Candidatus Obscuribacterales bacterium]|nr:zinc ribbon domain-containing protein [Candidatus Obscuribacterales bacterium]
MARLSLTSNQVDELEIRATVLNDTFASEDLASSPAAQFILHCPHCQSETLLGDKFCQDCGGLQPAFEEKTSFASLVSMLQSNSKLLYFSVGVLSASLLVLTCFYFFAKVPGDLQNSLSANKLNEAVAIAEKLMVSRLGSLQGHDAELYSDAFFRRAQVFAVNKNYKLALLDLSRVLPSYSKRAEVAELRKSCGILAWQGNSVEIDNPKLQESKRSKLAARVKVASTTAQAIVPSAHSAINEAKSLVQSESGPAASGGALPIESSCELDSEEAEMATYNRHLADYFSRRESKSSKASAIKEPPSFSEWVQSGKSEF